jgi:cytochrome c oxidase cbb3-type subunit I/II
MPAYEWLARKNIDFLSARKKISVLRNLGVPYDDNTVAQADVIAEKEALKISQDLASQGGPAGLENKEIIALIAYMQALGQKKSSTVPAGTGN